MKIGFIGCVESSRIALDALLSINEVNVSAVITKKDSSINADFSDLSKICIERNIPYHLYKSDNQSEAVNFLKAFNLDVIYCFGWSHILCDEFLTLTPYGVIGFHPAKLPENRGRHPIIWALALGLEETASTFFKIDKGIDSGPILSQKLIQIEDEDNSKTLYKKIMSVASNQIKQFSKEMANGKASFQTQAHHNATYWRKRSSKDGLIDWRMTAKSIYNLVRALSPPYPGAEFKYKDVLYSVTECEPIYNKFPKNYEPGYILKKTSNSLLVKVAGNDAVLLKNLNYNLSILGNYL